MALLLIIIICYIQSALFQPVSLDIFHNITDQSLIKSVFFLKKSILFIKLFYTIFFPVISLSSRTYIFTNGTCKSPLDIS